MKLYDIPKGSIIRVESTNGEKIDITFHHLDGMYSYCTAPDGRIVHLSASTPLVKVDDHYEVEQSTLWL